ncbi:hypothetical protein AB0J27_17525 [Micromonospora chokoriensis]
MIAFQSDVDVRTEPAANAQGWSKSVAIVMSRQAEATAVEARAVDRIPECCRLTGRLGEVIAGDIRASADRRRQRSGKVELSEPPESDVTA